MALPAYLRPGNGGCHLAIKVQPRASKNEIGDPLGDELKIKIAAPPVDSAANEALVRFLADVLDCPRGDVQLVRGNTSRHKLVLIHGMVPEKIADRLAQQARGVAGREQ